MIIFLVVLRTGNLHSCDSFEKVLVQVVERDDSDSNETINGCLERERLRGKIATEAYIRHQKIPRLGKDAVRHLVQLKALSFCYCDLDVVEKQAFRNLPMLNNLQISYCNQKKVLVQLKDKNDVKYNETIDGCIERIKFGNRTIVSAYVRKQDIKKLGRDSVRNMGHLNTISFWGCTTEDIEPGAFRNIPKIKNIQISYCDLIEIPKGIFNLVPSIELLRLHNNKIDIIENQAFANLSALKQVYCSYNALEYWNREWFEDSPNLEVMDFQYNKIRTIPRRAFASLGNLKQIYFDWNEISTIQPEAFLGLKRLQYLGLRNNRLKAIDENAFPNDISIRSLLISANYLNYLSNEVMKKISVSDIFMEYNPWKCPCLDRIHYWIRSTNGTLRQTDSCVSSRVPVCAYSKSFTQTCLEYVDDELTQRYIGVLKNLPEYLPQGCARLD